MPSPSAALRRLARSWPIGLVLAAVALLSAPRFGNGLVWDDVHLMDVAESLARAGDPLRVFRHSTLGLVYGDPERAERDGIDLYRPLALLSFWAGHALRGRDPAPQHAINLALHLACIALVFALALARRGEHERTDPHVRPAALLAAALFGLSPPLVEAHVWISGRFDLLCALFTLIALLFWLAAARRTGRSRLGFDLAAAVAFAAALLAKEAALFVLPVLPFWPGLTGSWRARAQRCLPFVGGLAAHLALRVAALGLDGGSDVSGTQLLTAAARFGAVVVDAIASLVLPLRVYSRLPKEDYDALGAGGVLACAALALLLAHGAWRVRGRLPWSAFGLLWLAVLLLPVAVVTAGAWPGFGRFLYLPATLFSIGVADAATTAYDRVRSRRGRAALRAALGAYVLWLGLAMHVYTFDWRDDDTLYGSIIAAAPDRSHGYGFLGITYIERRQYRQAAVLLGKAVEIAPSERRYLSKLGHALLFSGDLPAARQLARAAIARLGDAPEFHLLEAYTWLDADSARAARALLECLREDPDNAEGLEALAYLRTSHPRAERFREEFARLAPEPRYAALQSLLE